jgi:hypothetical protein
MDNIYIKINPDWDHEHKSKYGYVEGDKENIINRLMDSTEEHSEHSKMKNIYTFNKNDNYKLCKEIDKLFSLIASSLDRIKIVEDIYGIELPLLRELHNYLIKSSTKQSNEFIHTDSLELMDNIIKEEFPLLGLDLVKEWTDEEVEEVNRRIIEHTRVQAEENYKSLLTTLKNARTRQPKIPKRIHRDQEKWFKRIYQTEIIDKGFDTLYELHKFYLELATGAGKSYIIFKILQKIKPKVIVYLSPRKKVNVQNCSSKYLALLDNDYLAFNLSNSTLEDFSDFKVRCANEHKKMIITGCCQHCPEKLYDIIHTYNLSNICFWFDEAHWCIEGWVRDYITNKDIISTDKDKKKKEYIEFLLTDTNKITNRIFTSASPDKEFVQNNSDIFGELYCPITVKELSGLKFLCPLECHILEKNIENSNLIEWILDGFTKHNRNFGFSFHSRDNNACNLFLTHYIRYVNKQTNIKPYLLIQEHGLNEKNKKALLGVDLDYNYRLVENFENTPNSLAYVVKRFDMGYDFKDLDYIVITDTKVAYKDIIQCIGRGLRSDKKGPGGTNVDKKLVLMLPTYIDDEDTNPYKNVIEVLRYLVFNLDYDIESLFIRPLQYSGPSESSGYDYSGGKDKGSLILDLLYSSNILNRPTTTKTLIKFCKKYHIYTEQDYYTFKKNNPSLKLKENLYEYPGFFWKNIVDPNGEKYYNTLAGCNTAKDKIINEKKNKLNEEDFEIFWEEYDDNGWKELHKLDKKIPPYTDLSKFYPNV